MPFKPRRVPAASLQWAPSWGIFKADDAFYVEITDQPVSTFAEEKQHLWKMSKWTRDEKLEVGRASTR